MLVGQLNMRRSPLVGELTLQFLRSSSMDVLLVQDPPQPWIHAEFLDRYRVFVPRGADSLTAILVDSKLQASLSPLGASRVCVVRVGTGQDSIYFFSGYLQPGTGVGCAEIGHALRALGGAPLRCLGIDGNGHSPVWGPASVESNQQGILVENLLASEDLLSLNSPDSPPTYIGDNNTRSWIDVTAVSMELLERVVHWRVVADAGLGSDHALLEWEFLIRPSFQAPVRRPNWNKVDWTQFRHCLTAQMTHLTTLPMDTPSQLDAAVERFTRMLQQLVQDQVPWKRVCQFSREWWTPQIQMLRMEMKRAARRWQKRRSFYCRTEYHRLRRLLREEIRRGKRASWRAWCASFTRDNPWKLLRTLKPREKNSVDDLRVDDCWIRDDKSKALKLAEVFFPQLPAADLPIHNIIDHTWDTARPPGLLPSPTVSSKEIRTQCYKMRTKAATGVDDLSILIMKRCFRELISFLRRVFNASLSLGFFPSRWREARVLALRKQGKSSYEQVRSYRPISLLNHFGKLLEAIVNSRLKNWLESKHLLSPDQAGFRPGRHAQGACWRLVEAITSAFRARDQVQAVALDIQAAYDSVWRNGLLHKLRRKKIPSYLIHWIHSFISQRKCSVQVGDAEVPCSPECGLPQGSPLSPTLFLIYIDDLLEELKKAGVNVQAYADDIITWLRGNFRQGIAAPELRSALKIVDDWSRSWRLTFNPQKCSAICFSGPRVKIQRCFQVGLLSGPIPTVGVIRYLGLWLDAHLLWHKHIRESVAGAKRLLWSMRRIVGKRWGAAPGVLLRLIHQVVLARLFYGAECWGTVIRSEQVLRMLDRVLGTSARLAMGLNRFTPTDTALVVADIMPARLQLLRRICRFMVRNHRYDFVSYGQDQPSDTFLLPREVATSWFRRAVLHRGLLRDPPPVRAHLLLSAIDRGLRQEWQSQWISTPGVEDARAVFPVVGSRWMSESVRDRGAFTLLMRFLVSDVYLGSLHLPQDDLYDSYCPICGEDLSRRHILEECRGLTLERALLSCDFPEAKLSDLGWLARFRERPLSRFLMAVQARFAAAGEMDIRSEQVQLLSDIE